MCLLCYIVKGVEFAERRRPINKKKNTSSRWFLVPLCNWYWCQRSVIWISIILLALSTRHHITCCQLWSMTSDESDKASTPLHSNASCEGLSPRSDGMSPSANLSLEIQLSSCDTHSNSNRNITALWKRGVSYWMTPPSPPNPPNILLGKDGVTEQKW